MLPVLKYEGGAVIISDGILWASMLLALKYEGGVVIISDGISKNYQNEHLFCTCSEIYPGSWPHCGFFLILDQNLKLEDNDPYSVTDEK
jgi:hypothetical protein